MAVVALLLACSVLPAYAYWDDVHYGLTYLVAREVGYTPEQAYRMAAADLSIDYNDITEPQQLSEFELASAKLSGGMSDTIPPGKQAPRWRFHAFRNEVKFKDPIGQGADAQVAEKDVEAQRGELFRAATKAENTNPGAFMHFFQDELPHHGYGSAWGHYYNPFSPETSTVKLRQSGLMLGGGVDWLSAYDVNLNSYLVTQMIAWLRRFMAEGSPRQSPLAPTAAQFQTVIDGLRQNSPPPGGLTLAELRLYTDYVSAKHGFGTAPTLTPAQELKFKTLDEGPDLPKAMAIIAEAMRQRGMVEMAAGGKGLRDYVAARKLYEFDADGNPLPGQLDQWVLTGALKVHVEGGAPGQVEIIVLAPSTMSGQAEYALTKPPLVLNVRASGTWEGIPVGEVIVEARREGKVLVRQEHVVIDKRQNEVTISLGGAVKRQVAVLREGYPKLLQAAGSAIDTRFERTAPVGEGKTARRLLEFSKWSNGHVTIRMSCQSGYPGADYDRTYDFDWAPLPAAITTEPRLDVNLTGAMGGGGRTYPPGTPLPFFTSTVKAWVEGGTNLKAPAGQEQVRITLGDDEKKDAQGQYSFDRITSGTHLYQFERASTNPDYYSIDVIFNPTNHDQWGPSGFDVDRGSVAFKIAYSWEVKNLTEDEIKAVNQGSTPPGGTTTGPSGPSGPGPGVTAGPGGVLPNLVAGSSSGNVQFQVPGGPWQPLSAGTQVPPGSTIRTGADGSLTLQRPGGRQAILSPATTLTIDEQGHVKLKGGRVRIVNPGEPEAGSSFSVQTPSATVSDKQTDYTVSYNKATGNTTVRVTQGQVLIAPANQALAPVTIDGGQQVTVSPQAVGTPTAIPGARGAGGTAGAAGSLGIVAQTFRADDGRNLVRAWAVSAASPLLGKVSPGDFLISADEVPLTDAGQLAGLVGAKRGGEVMALQIWRNGQQSAVTVPLAPAPAAAQRIVLITGEFRSAAFAGGLTGYLDPVARTASGILTGTRQSPIDGTFQGSWDPGTTATSLQMTGKATMLIQFSFNGTITGQISRDGKGNGQFQANGPLGAETGNWTCQPLTAPEFVVL